MKRSWIKRKTPLRKVSLLPLNKVKKELMEFSKAIAKIRDGNVCFTCGARNLKGKNWHGGHFIKDSTGGVLLRYNLANIHSQCYRCNMILDGNEGEYYIKMVNKYGQEFVDELFRIKHQDKARWGAKEYRELLEQRKLEYKTQLEYVKSENI